MKNRNVIEKGKLLLLMLATCFLAACTNNEEPIENNPNNGTPKEYIVSLGFSGEITDITESPLSRAVGNDLYGIQVYSAPTATNEEYAPYAYGLFDNKDNMVIKLLEGYKYKFVASMVVDGKNVLYSNHEGNYYQPFYGGDDTDGIAIGQNFEYSNAAEMIYLDWGEVSMKGNAESFGIPMVERFYGLSNV